jgi:hypothetical protein
MFETKVEIMFEKYPKTRPLLPKEIEEIYTAYYKLNRDGQTAASSLSQKMESWCHKQVAKDVVDTQNTKKATLELGAGTLNQLPYEPNCQPYDIVEPFVDLYKGSSLLARIRNVYSDISEIPIGCRYDRITSISVLEHVCNLPEVVARSGILLLENGAFRVSFASEGTLLWTLGWKLTTGLEFRVKYGNNYGMLMKYEHVNTAREIEEVLEYFFEKVRCKVYGLIKSISFYRFYECRNPRVERCYDFIKKVNTQ